MAQQQVQPIAVDASELSSTPQAPETQIQKPQGVAAAAPIPVDPQELSSTADPFAGVGGKSIDTNNMIAPQPSTVAQLKMDPGMPIRSKIREIESYTQEGRQVHPILAKIGDFLKNVYVPGGESPSVAPLPDNWAQMNQAQRDSWIEAHPPLAGPVPPPFPGLAGALEGAATESAAATTVARAAAPATAAEAEPGIVQKIVKGQKVAQPKAASAIRNAAASATENPTVQPLSLPRIFEQPIDATEAQAKSLYSQIDQAAGTDIKALREKLGNTEYQIRNLTDTEADQAMEAKLEESRRGLLDKIEQAKQEAIKAGVDPSTLDQADLAYRKAQALRDVEKIFKNPSNIYGNVRAGQEEMINVKPTVQALQKLQYADKFGSSRLEQALGEQNANALLGKLYQAERLGQSAISARRIAEWTAGGLVGAATLGSEIKNAVSGK